MSPRDDIELAHDDGFPVGFTLLDNRDIWSSGRTDLLLRPVTLGVWVAIASLPRGWHFREEWLRRELHLGRDALRMALRELEAAGRLTRHQLRSAAGVYSGRRWVLHRGGSGSSTPPSACCPSPVNSTTAGPTTANQPPLTSTEKAPITENTTTTAPAQLILPAGLMPEQARVVVGLMTKLGDDKIGQALLDELAWAIRQRPEVRRPVAYLKALIKSMQEGSYVPEGALVIAAERQKHDASTSARTERERRAQALAAQRNDPAAQARIKALIEATAKELRMRPSQKP